MDKPQIKPILDLLRRRYGSRQLQPSHDPLRELVQTILSQNTSDHNSRPAFQELRQAFDNWESLLTAEIEEIADSIKSGGLELIKAQRIQRSLREIKRRRGKLDLQFLSEMPVEEAREWLRQLPGVGNKTANCVLLFAFGQPALPVDTHIYRISKRLGLINSQDSLEKAHKTLEEMVPAEDIYEFHVLTIEHGRQCCTALHPGCSQCILECICPFPKTLSPANRD